MAKVSDNEFPKLVLEEQASTPSTPAAGTQKIFIDDADHHLKRVDESDVVVDLEDNSGVVDDTAYNATTWNGDTTHAPSKNAVRDKIESLSAGGRTLISSQTPTGTGSVSFASISAAYQKLIIEYAVRGTAAADSVSMDITLNNDTTDANYQRQVITAYQLTTVAGAGGADNVIDDAVIGNTGPASEFSHGQIEILFYANTGFNKQIGYRNRKRRDTSSVQNQINRGAIDWESTAAINRVDLILASGNFASGSIINLYGEL